MELAQLCYQVAECASLVRWSFKAWLRRSPSWFDIPVNNTNKHDSTILSRWVRPFTGKHFGRVACIGANKVWTFRSSLFQLRSVSFGYPQKWQQQGSALARARQIVAAIEV